MSKESELLELINQIANKELRSKIHVTLEDFVDGLRDSEEELEEYVDPYKDYNKRLVSSQIVKDQYSGISLEVCEYEYTKEGCENVMVIKTHAPMKLYGPPENLVQ